MESTGHSRRDRNNASPVQRAPVETVGACPPPEENHKEGEMKKTALGNSSSRSMSIKSITHEVAESKQSRGGGHGVDASVAADVAEAGEGEEGAPDVSRDVLGCAVDSDSTVVAAGGEEGLVTMGGQRDEVCWSAAGGLGADSVSVASDDLQDWRMVASLWADECNDVMCEGRYADDDDDDDDCFYLSEKERSEAARRTTDARIWRALAAAIKVELEEVKVSISPPDSRACMEVGPSLIPIFH